MLKNLEMIDESVSQSKFHGSSALGFCPLKGWLPGHMSLPSAAIRLHS